MRWYQQRRGGWLIRLCGAALLALAYAASTELRRRAVNGPIENDVRAYLLAACAFLSGSFGTAAALLGHHLFDRVQVARRWSRGD